jgi:hypothetical protein
MILTPVFPAAAADASDTAVTLRLIGTLDRVLIESISDAIAGLTAPGRRTLIVVVRDLVAMRDESLDRFLATLDAFRAAGNRVFIDATPTWRKVVRGREPSFEASTSVEERSSRRQVIICHSLEKRAGAA